MRFGAAHPGPWFNIKMPSFQYRKSHCGDKTVVRTSYLHNGISYTGKMTSLYWIRVLLVLLYIGFVWANEILRLRKDSLLSKYFMFCLFNSLAPVICDSCFKNWFSMPTCCLISWVFPNRQLAHEWHGILRRKDNISSGNGLVPSGNKPLPGPMLTLIYVAIWRH